MTSCTRKLRIGGLRQAGALKRSLKLGNYLLNPQMIFRWHDRLFVELMELGQLDVDVPTLIQYSRSRKAWQSALSSLPFRGQPGPIINPIEYLWKYDFRSSIRLHNPCIYSKRSVVQVVQIQEESAILVHQT